MASITSLPELITGISSVAVFAVPAIAVGDVLGSCMFNLFLIALLDVLSRPRPATAQSAPGHVLPAAFGVLLLSLVSTAILGGKQLPAFGWVGVTSMVLLLLYGLAMRLVFVQERRLSAAMEEVAERLYPEVTAKKAGMLYALNALFIIGAAAYLPQVGQQIAAMTGLGTTFVGDVLIGISTSLPEIVVSVMAVRIGALDLAFGNLLGSNLFNLAILALDDVFYTRGVLLEQVSAQNVIAALAAILMTATVIVGLVYRTPTKRWLLSWDALGLIVIYLLAIWLLYATVAREHLPA